MQTDRSKKLNNIETCVSVNIGNVKEPIVKKKDMRCLMITGRKLEFSVSSMTSCAQLSGITLSFSEQA